MREPQKVNARLILEDYGELMDDTTFVSLAPQNALENLCEILFTGNKEQYSGLTIDMSRGLIHACCILSSRYRFAILAMFP